ncbi:MAG: M20 aminoacylase family protein [Alphaproteobacteria bacterium]|jgi:hippurate hydrolase|nr:M20 aminoacylase family protein [Rhodospirillales bacterium]MDP6588205.1 M20 aminoacylase family protein [Alphaproteobacteria bacterium]MDP6819595.1 M20 aminoacylase family protein [Alphaproteobacteria bacterium]|tara:strand:- start:94 stop:1269 length:1176 start_codon:yes stop_codon:yes gene_type:complete
MPMINRIAEFQSEMAAWRRDIHAHPELGFEETRTAEIVARELESFGLEVHRGLARTGVVGVLKGAPGSAAIGLRADMDALPIAEKNEFGHSSRNDGVMHACGHDGHTAMLLGAAKYLAETGNFSGTVYFIFQPAEEGQGGAREMVDEGLFEQFPVDGVYGLHNWPGLEIGEFAVRPGPMMAACDAFEINVIGEGTHGAMPHLGIDPVLCGAEIVGALQSIASRVKDPLDSAVLSVTKFHGGDAFNVIPERAELAGTARSFSETVRRQIEDGIQRISEGIAAAHRCRVEINYMRQFPATVNHEAETELAAEAAIHVAGEANVRRDLPPCMGSEDFSYMLEKRPGSYIWMGNAGAELGCLLHNPNYDFNDEALGWGASYWASLVESLQPKAAG